MKIPKNGLYVVRCLKGNNNRFGFGFRHKKGQFVSYIGEGVKDINNAFVYKKKDGEECGLEDFDYEEFYEYIPVEIKILRRD